MTLQLNGELIPDDWAELYREYGFQTGFYCPSDVRSAICKLTAGEELVLEINSIGGSVDAAAEIYSLIQSCGNPTRAIIQSLAASAASYMILSCSRIEIARPAQMMIHLSSCSGYGNKYQHQQAAQALDACDRSILATYTARCGSKSSTEELERLMEAETYLTAEDAVKIGLADAIASDGSPAATSKPTFLVASAVNNTVRAMRVLPDIQELLTRKAFQTQQDQLNLEKARYIRE